MDESLVDIVLILLATLVAISTVPTFEIEPPMSQEAETGMPQLQPLQVAISDNGTFLTPVSEGPPAVLNPADFYALLMASHPDRVVEFTADRNAPAYLMLNANTLVQRAGRQAVFLVQVAPGTSP
ncbi:MAG: hypothetical protein F4Y00_07375 [Bacteroidetes bacterium SB0662_bin_6]|nr:hypothetical protein [Bacteroidetes bacterium SB0668_bin_1]MYE04773.1 hypothetical protein [Bacteroidetes bacterium SB0662_bin_6]